MGPKSKRIPGGYQSKAIRKFDLATIPVATAHHAAAPAFPISPAPAINVGQIARNKFGHGVMAFAWENGLSRGDMLRPFGVLSAGKRDGTTPKYLMACGREIYLFRYNRIGGLSLDGPVCGAAGSANIVPNWHDRTGHAVPFTKGRFAVGPKWTRAG
ncbi:hypothetical protein ACFFWD_35455 [Bradyrhizobium erythrophlei]|uniref:hypothetical protein n=1 Tax=Bradyrhizobium erythrophlei TaxID=1437360 RepID=UPI0035F0D927